MRNLSLGTGPYSRIGTLFIVLERLVVDEHIVHLCVKQANLCKELHTLLIYQDCWNWIEMSF